MAAPTTPRRLDAEARRIQLIDAGVALARTTPVPQLTHERLAAEVGVSKGLLFHYFPTRDELHAAIVQHTADKLLASLAANPDGAPFDQLGGGLDTFIEFIEEHRSSYVSLARGSSNSRLLEIFEDTRMAIVDLIADRLGIVERTGLVVLAIRGWVAFAEEVILAWLDDDTIERDALRTFLVDSAVTLVGAAVIPIGAQVQR